MRAVLTDVEGTTTRLSLVRDVLFPYSRRRLPDFVRQHRGDEAVESVLAEVRALEPHLAPDDTDGAVAVLVRWIDDDRKVTPLKTLQGWIWSDGYRAGELEGHVYDDAVIRLRAWRALGIGLYVYSSGSVAAQKLLFSHTAYGDLTGLFSGFFDTTMGGKLEDASYARIATAIDTAPADVTFLSDNVAELDAARIAGMQTVWVERDSVGGAGARGDPTKHRKVSSFAEL